MGNLPTSDRFFAVGVTEVIEVPTIAATTGIPTRAELDGGTNLTGEIADISGWMQKAGSIGTADLKNRFTGNLPGRITVDESSITFYADQEGTDVRGVLTKDKVTHIVFMDGGDVAASKMDIYTVRVASVGKVRSTSDQASQITVTFSITKVPVEDVAIPAHA